MSTITQNDFAILISALRDAAANCQTEIGLHPDPSRYADDIAALRSMQVHYRRLRRRLEQIAAVPHIRPFPHINLCGATAAIEVGPSDV